MQLRNVDLRSVGPSVQKLWPTTLFARKMSCILRCNAKKIRSMFSRLVRDLVQKAKWSKIFRRSRIQALPTISNNLWRKCDTLINILMISDSSGHFGGSICGGNKTNREAKLVIRRRNENK